MTHNKKQKDEMHVEFKKTSFLQIYNLTKFYKKTV